MWFSSRKTRCNTRVGSIRRTLPLRLEPFEEKIVPSTFTVLNTGDSGVGSLRQAILDANANPGADVIQFAPGVTGTITLTSGELDITDDVDLLGPGSGVVTVSGNNASRVLSISANANISGLTITDGNSSDGSGIANLEGALTVSNSTFTQNIGGGIFNSGSLTVSNSTFTENIGFILSGVSLGIPYAALVGSGIHNRNGGMATVRSCTFSNNSGSGIFNDSGSTASVADSTFSDNEAGFGGGIYSFGGTAQVNNSTFFHNSASGQTLSSGAGINAFSGGTLMISNSTFIGNQAGYNQAGQRVNGGGFGGGLSVASDVQATVSNSTFFGNEAYGRGGAIFRYLAILTVTNSTLSGNIAVHDSGGGIDGGDGPGPTIGNTIIAGNTAPAGPDFFRAATSNGYNLIGNVSGSLGFGAPGDLLNANPLLAPLGNYGGPTQTMALLPGSPAIDAGSNALVPAGVTTDQRGFTRIVGPVATGGRVDIGAFEGQIVGTPGTDLITVGPGSQLGVMVTVNTTVYDNLAGGVLQIDGLGGSDTYSVSFGSTLTTPIMLVGGGRDTVNVYGSGDPNTANYITKNTVAQNTITWGPTAGSPLDTIQYSGIQATNIYGGQGSNFIKDPGAQTTIYCGPRANTVVITATSGSGVTINGGSGTNNYIINMGSLLGPVNINSTTGTSTVTVYGPPGSNVLTLSSTQLTGAGQAINFNLGTTATNITVDGSAGTNQLVLQGPPPGPVTALHIAVAPTAGAITASMNPVNVASAISASAPFTELDGSAVTAVWNWGDSSTSAGTVSQSGTAGTVSASHTYGGAGVYTLTLTLTNAASQTGQSVFQYAVVYDPFAGFVTGGGWINSPAGAYLANPSLTGKANLGIDVKYQQANTVPKGQTDFDFPTANLSFHSTSYDWLVITVPQAQYQGSGTLNGAGNYGFIVTAWDGKQAGGGGTDKFRIKIWNKNNGNAVVYDTQPGAAQTAAPTTTLGGGNITVHTMGGGGAAAPPRPGHGGQNNVPLTPGSVDGLFAAGTVIKLSLEAMPQPPPLTNNPVARPLAITKPETLILNPQATSVLAMLQRGTLDNSLAGWLDNPVHDARLLDQLARDRVR